MTANPIKRFAVAFVLAVSGLLAVSLHAEDTKTYETRTSAIGLSHPLPGSSGKATEPVQLILVLGAATKKGAFPPVFTLTVVHLDVKDQDLDIEADGARQKELQDHTHAKLDDKKEGTVDGQRTITWTFTSDRSGNAIKGVRWAINKYDKMFLIGFACNPEDYDAKFKEIEKLVADFKWAK